MPYLDASYAVLLPSILLVVGGLACLLLEVAAPALRRRARAVAVVTLAASAVALYCVGRTGLDPAANPLFTEVGTDLLVLALAPAFYLAALAALLLVGPT